MKVSGTPIAGVHVVDPELLEDERGFFARTWCAEEMAAHGLDARIAQCSVSYNHRGGTLRGMHWQAAPHEEVKLVRCTAGSIFDVCVDLRPDSPTFRTWFGIELSADNCRALYIPAGCSHGFLTLDAGTEVFYQISVPYVAAAARGHRHDDPAVAIAWPRAIEVVSQRDRELPTLAEALGRG
ncbi:MAG TPA: dTDP-4-dehydrorhamnose 3,5-epimerase family protein [Longimicrobiales bacterium]|nr:dTDP-4-dehydrorhamnose 3,5-epimerase family protein [Longimicrobiales bacterium]